VDIALSDVNNHMTITIGEAVAAAARLSVVLVVAALVVAAASAAVVSEGAPVVAVEQDHAFKK
jgi:hypothetical protein